MSNTYTIEENKNVALVQLNKTWQIPDQVNIIYYYNENREIDFLLSIGKGSGFGPEYYSIVQAHEETLVIKISTDPSDVSQLVYDQKALCFCNPNARYPEPRWYMLTDIPTPNSPEGYTRNFTELIEPAIYRNLDDGFRWFFVAGILKREDDFLTSEQTLKLIKQNIGYFKKSTFDIEFDFPEGTEKNGNSYYLPEIEYIDKPKFKIKVYDYSGTDITNDCTISLGDNARLEYDPVTEKYTIYKQYTEDSRIIISANSETLGLVSEAISLWFPEVAYYGTCTIEDNEITMGTLNSKLIYHDLITLPLIYNLDKENSILLMPRDFGKFKHIFDINGLDYIKNYVYFPNLEYQNNIYSAYQKVEPVVIEDFRQYFTYNDEWVGNNEGSYNNEGGGAPSGNYYTKEEIDQLIYGIGPSLIKDAVTSTTTTWSSSKLEPIYIWVQNKMNSEIGDKFTIETTASGTSYYTDTATQTTMTVTVKTKYNGNLVDANDTPSGWTKTGTGTYTKSVTGESGTSISATEFYYTTSGVTVHKSSTTKTISSTNPAYYGLVASNNGSPTAETLSQIVSGLGRITSAKNATETISNSSADTCYLWILTKGTAEATQFGINILENALSGKSFTSPQNSEINMTGYKLYISSNPVASGSSYTNVNLKINL